MKGKIKQKRILPMETIGKRITSVRKIFKLVAKENENIAEGEKIKNPQVPSRVTESLAIHLLREEKILKRELKDKDFHFDYPMNVSAYMKIRRGMSAIEKKKNKMPDAIAYKESSKNKISNIKNIEIKGSGENAFNSYTKKDRASNYLIWIHCGSMFTKKDYIFEVNIIKEVGRHYAKLGKVDLSALKKKAGRHCISQKFNLNRLLAERK